MILAGDRCKLRCTTPNHKYPYEGMEVLVVRRVPFDKAIVELEDGSQVHVDYSWLVSLPFDCPKCGQRIDDGLPCGCGARCV